ncbi:MAG: DUF4190 domain-containing protein [Bacteroidia bacterium]
MNKVILVLFFTLANIMLFAGVSTETNTVAVKNTTQQISVPNTNITNVPVVSGQPTSPKPTLWQRITGAKDGEKMNILALVGGILGIVSLVASLLVPVLGILAGIEAIILGVMGLIKIKKTGEKGKGWAIAALACGGLGLLISFVAAVVGVLYLAGVF